MCFIKNCRDIKAPEALEKIPFYKSISESSSGYNSDSDNEMDNEFEKDYSTNSSMEPGAALSTTILEAKLQGRLTHGINQVARLLEMDSTDVMFCVVPTDASTDITTHIHLTLIEAFCLENDIRIIKVDSSEKLRKIINNVHSKDCNENKAMDNRDIEDDFSCLLIEFPSVDVAVSDAEEAVFYYHLDTCDVVPQPVLTLEEPTALITLFSQAHTTVP